MVNVRCTKPCNKKKTKKKLFLFLIKDLTGFIFIPNIVMNSINCTEHCVFYKFSFEKYQFSTYF